MDALIHEFLLPPHTHTEYLCMNTYKLEAYTCASKNLTLGFSLLLNTHAKPGCFKKTVTLHYVYMYIHVHIVNTMCTQRFCDLQHQHRVSATADLHTGTCTCTVLLYVYLHVCLHVINF